ncbi:MAG: DNA cytosine methyltransferase, partial [Nitrosomonas sp.]|nr:DNA cytosine methyltransferase [Nitrosomonas sp.]
MVNYYNEFDPKAAAWLRELIKAGLIPAGHIDDRSILEVEPKDIEGYTQHHFFAGIGGWSYALKLAGWPDDKPVWTASLPCQPFSTAGKGLGKQDERHLLPHFLELVKQCRPDTIFGEQVEGAIRHGWLDDLQANMEAEGYAIGHCSGWPTPSVSNALNRETDAETRVLQGRQVELTHIVASLNLLTGSTAETTNTGQLNPALSRWLMGLPEEWCIAAIQAHRSIQTQRRKRG